MVQAREHTCLKGTDPFVVVFLIKVSDFVNGLLHHILPVLIDILLFNRPRPLHLDHDVAAVLSPSSALSLQKVMRVWMVSYVFVVNSLKGTYIVSGFVHTDNKSLLIGTLT